MRRADGYRCEQDEYNHTGDGGDVRSARRPGEIPPGWMRLRACALSIGSMLVMIRCVATRMITGRHDHPEPKTCRLIRQMGEPLMSAGARTPTSPTGHRLSTP